MPKDFQFIFLPVLEVFGISNTNAVMFYPRAQTREFSLYYVATTNNSAIYIHLTVTCVSPSPTPACVATLERIFVLYTVVLRRYDHMGDIFNNSLAKWDLEHLWEEE